MFDIGEKKMNNNYSLTTPQQNIYNLSKFYTDTAICNIGGTLEFSMEGLTADVLTAAIRALIHDAEGLRLQIAEQDGEPSQFVADYKETTIPVLSAKDWTDEQIEAYVQKSISTPIDLLGGALYRFAILECEGSFCVMVIHHHIIGDAWSLTLIDNAIYHNCVSILGGNEPHMDIQSYTAFAEAEQKYLSSAKYQKDKAFWDEQYANLSKCAEIKPGIVKSDSPAASRLYAEVSPELSASIRVFCAEHEYSPATLFETAMLVYLHRINSEDRMPSLGLAVLNRNGVKEKNTIGMFISTVLMTMDVNESKPVSELCEAVDASHMQLFRHQKYPYSHILSDARHRDHSIDKLFDVMMSYQNAQIAGDVKAHSKWYTNGNSEVALAFHIDDRDHDGIYRLNLDYQTAEFSGNAEVTLLKDRILHIVEQIIREPSKAVAEISILPEAERKMLIHSFNDTYVDMPKKCMHELFEEQVEKTPNTVAVVFEKQSYTYREINDLANQIAHKLRTYGVKPNDIVPIIAHRSHLILAAQFGVLKAGGAYLPIDPTYPQDRIHYMLDDAGCEVAIILDAEAPQNVNHIIDLATLEDGKTFDNLSNVNKQDDLCYVIYTSGSTGKPKGTMLMHKNAVNYSLDCSLNVYGGIITDERTIVSTTTIGFDIYVTESLLALVNRLTVYYADDDECRLQRRLAKLVEANDIEILQTTPTKMKVLMADKDERAYLGKLKCLILGGEPFPESLYEELRKYTSARIFNIYGPTETTVWSSLDEVISPEITIGKPIANTQIHILNEKNQLCPLGIPGELCIAGNGVCKGYLRREELTAEKFSDNPYGEGKLYHTGDLASYRTDGRLTCYGRMDSQVKIKGLRVELGEVESVMNAFDGIKLSVSAVDSTNPDHPYLLGYYIADEDIDEAALRTYMAAALPKYMVPNFFIRMEKIAFTPNGKIDRKALPKFNPNVKEEHTEVVFENEEQKAIHGIIAEMLGDSTFDIDEDIFSLGLDSLGAIKLIAQISKIFNMDYSVSAVYENNTVRRLASSLPQTQTTDFKKASLNHNLNLDGVTFKCMNNGKDLLVTGGSGFLGAHLISQLLTSTKVKIFCLVRNENRLYDTLRYYFGDTFVNRFKNRIVPVIGDITKDDLGIAKDHEVRQNIISAVFHCAADVRHFGLFETSYQTNTIGTKNVITFCAEQSSSLHHMSTITVSGIGMVKISSEKDVFTEDDLYIGQHYEDNIYCHSKFLAEKLVFDAIEKGLVAKIYRLGNISERSCDGVHQRNQESNAFLMRSRAMQTLGIISSMFKESMIEKSPVDKCSEAIVKLSSVQGYDLFHIVNPNAVSAYDYYKSVYPNLVEVSDEEWLHKLEEMALENADCAIMKVYVEIARNRDCNIPISYERTQKLLIEKQFNWN